MKSVAVVLFVLFGFVTEIQAQEAVQEDIQEVALLSEGETIVQMHEEAIRRRGGRGIVLDEECCRIAQRWANYMASTDRFGHGGGEQIIAQCASVNRCFSLWIASSGHRRWVLSNSYRCGWGCARSLRTGKIYYAGVFRGRPVAKAAAAVTSAVTAPLQATTQTYPSQGSNTAWKRSKRFWRR